MANIINASPQYDSLGTQDRSRRQVFPADVPLPQFLPLVYAFAKKGPSTKTVVSPDQRSAIYGKESFNELEKWFNHSTLFSNEMAATGNVSMFHRIIPADAATANIRIYMDIVEDLVDQYVRGVDGTYTLDALGQRQVDGAAGQVAGLRVKYFYEIDPVGFTLGGGTPIIGTMTSVAGGVFAAPGDPSTLYPIYDFQASSAGEFGSNTGIKLYAPKPELIDKDIIKGKAYPYTIGTIDRDNSAHTTEVVRTKFGEDTVSFVNNPDFVHPVNGDPIELSALMPDRWGNTEDTRYEMVYPDIDKSHTYISSITTILESFAQVEQLYIAANPTRYDWSSDAIYDQVGTTLTPLGIEELFLANILGLTSSTGIPYTGVVLDETAVAPPANFTEFTPSSSTELWLGGGSDGTLSDSNFESGVVTEINKYADINSEVQDTAINVESALIDSGFTMPTKLELVDFISVRKDTNLVLSTFVHTDTDVNLTLASDQSRGTTLNNALKLAPESTFFGTAVMRGRVIQQSMIARSSVKKTRVPVTLEVAIKSADYMGAGNAKWKNGLAFDSAPGSIIESGYDIKPSFIPAGVKPLLWDTELNWVQPFDLKSYFFPAQQSSYPDDTSVLNSYFTAFMISHLNKIAGKAWRQFSGTTGLTNGQFADRVKAFVEAEIAFKFDNRYTIFPVVTFSAGDTLRGYSWTLIFKVGAPNMKTVMTTWTEAFRIEDLQSP